tara:strand:+ start:295 stop:921 length:627 start_codon:yes stop_codon:yes gene_type:complete
MRISDSAKRIMKNEILEDLYRKSEDELKDRAGIIAQQNRIYELEPYQAILDTLPVDLIAHSKDYKVNIQYKRDEDGNHALDEKWTHDYDKPVPAFIDPNSGGYSINNTPTIGKLDSRLHTEAAKLAEDMLALRKEKAELLDYLDRTLEEWSGPKQLKTVWPESLHKYLPVTKPRNPRDPNRIKPLTPTAEAAPTGLGTRLTNNLLEGS